MWCKECEKECILTSWKCSCGHYKTAHATSQAIASTSTTSATAGNTSTAQVRNSSSSTLITASKTSQPAHPSTNHPTSTRFAFPPPAASTTLSSSTIKTVAASCSTNATISSAFTFPKVTAVPSTTTNTAVGNSATSSGSRPLVNRVPSSTASFTSTTTTSTTPIATRSLPAATPPPSRRLTMTGAPPPSSATTTSVTTATVTTEIATVAVISSSLSVETNVTDPNSYIVTSEKTSIASITSTAPSPVSVGAISATPPAFSTSAISTSPSFETETSVPSSSTNSTVSAMVSANITVPATVSKLAVAVIPALGDPRVASPSSEWEFDNRKARTRSATLQTGVRDKSPSMIGRLFSNLRSRSPKKVVNDDSSLTKKSIRQLAINIAETEISSSSAFSSSSSSAFSSSSSATSGTTDIPSPRGSIQEPLTPLRAVRGEMLKSGKKISPSRQCKCGATITQFSSKFCGDCGNVVVETCSCGGLLEVDGVFCGECGKGKDIAEEKSRQASQSQAPEPLPVLPISQLGVVPALVALVTKIDNDNIQSSVEAMLGLERPIEANFDKERVRNYRVLGGGNDYSKDGIFDWSCPEYLSELTLPSQAVCSCVVTLGGDTKITLRIGEQEQCTQLLKKVLERAQSRTQLGEMSANEYVLKVLGKSAYLDGPNLVLDQLCVREAVRASKPVALILVKRPEPVPSKTSVWKDWGGGITVLASLIDALPISETLKNFRARNVGVLSVNFPHGEPTKHSMIHVKLFLLHGSTVITEAVTMAPFVSGSRNFQFAQELAPPMTRLATLPRETCVCFAILLVEGNNSSLLGWLRLHLFDERGLLLQGFFTCDVREPMKFPVDCVDFNHELISQLARGPIGFPTKKDNNSNSGNSNSSGDYSNNSRNSNSNSNSCVISFQLEDFGRNVIVEEVKKPQVGARGRAQTSVVSGGGAGTTRPLPMNFRPFQLPSVRSPVDRERDKESITDLNTPSRNSNECDSPTPPPPTSPPPMRVAIITEKEKTYNYNLIQDEKESFSSEDSMRSSMLEESILRSRGASVDERNSRLSSEQQTPSSASSSFSSPTRSRTASRSRKDVNATSSSSSFVDFANMTLDQKLARDPAYVLSVADKQHLWEVRHTMVFMDKPEIVTAFFHSIDWCDSEKRSEAHRMLDLLVPSPPETALQLLDVRFADTKLREYAVSSLSSISSNKLQPFLLQLTQCLKYELYHHSALANFLISLALRHPLSIGQPLYWHLRSEMCMHPALAERYALIIASYLSHGGPLVKELRKQKVALEQLQRVAEMVAGRKEQDSMTKEEMMEEYVGELVKLNCYLFARWGKMRLPLNPLVEVTTLIVDKCRFMSSKKVPLWLVFQNADPNDTEPVYVMFKSGDDLRQDMLTLQILSLMDEVWRQENLDLRLTTYRVIATGVNQANEGLGMIEVVLNADTTSGIQNDFGGGALGAFKLAPLKDYLEKHNPTEASLNSAVERFMRSSAGYCVATYIMGIGDRHNGNIMVSKDGRLFHIDFGHFLGNFKSKFGIRRERAPFVFTPEMAYVIGGKQFQQHPAYQQFEALCVQAFNAIRTRASVLGTLFGLMVPAGMPELLSEDDVTYMWEQLCLDLSPDEAAAVFLKELKASVSATSRRIDNFFHIAKHS